MLFVNLRKHTGLCQCNQLGAHIINLLATKYNGQLVVATVRVWLDRGSVNYMTMEIIFLV